MQIQTNVPHISSPLSARAHRLLLNKIQMGKSSSSSIDDFEHILEITRREYIELSIEHNLDECWIVVSRLVKL